MIVGRVIRIRSEGEPGEPSELHANLFEVVTGFHISIHRTETFLVASIARPSDLLGHDHTTRCTVHGE